MVEYDDQGRMRYNPELHFNQGKLWTSEDLEYLINWYNITGAEEMSLALGRTEMTIADKVFKLRKRGLMEKGKCTYNLRLLRLKDEQTVIA